MAWGQGLMVKAGLATDANNVAHFVRGETANLFET